MEENLCAKLIMGKDGKYMIRTLATIARSFTDRRKMANSAVAAKAMVTKYSLPLAWQAQKNHT